MTIFDLDDDGFKYLFTVPEITTADFQKAYLKVIKPPFVGYGNQILISNELLNDENLKSFVLVEFKELKKHYLAALEGEQINYKPNMETR